MTLQTWKILHPDYVTAVGIQKIGKSHYSHAAWNISLDLKVWREFNNAKRSEIKAKTLTSQRILE